MGQHGGSRRLITGRHGGGGRLKKGQHGGGGRLIMGQHGGGGRLITGRHGGGGRLITGQHGGSGCLITGRHGGGGRLIMGQHEGGGRLIACNGSDSRAEPSHKGRGQGELAGEFVGIDNKTMFKQNIYLSNYLSKLKEEFWHLWHVLVQAKMTSFF